MLHCASMYVIKAATEKPGKFDTKALAQALHGSNFRVSIAILTDVTLSEHGRSRRLRTGVIEQERPCND